MAAERHPTTAVDTSVIVSGLLSWHQNHAAAAEALTALLKNPRESVVLPLPALVESFAVMTRLPPPHRLSPRAALAVLSSFRARSTLVGLVGDEGWELLDRLEEQGIAGGASFDGLIAACARKGGASRILTFNRAHFERLGSDLEVVVPK